MPREAVAGPFVAPRAGAGNGGDGALAAAFGQEGGGAPVPLPGP